MKHELIAKDYVLYLIQYYASMQNWSKEEIIGQIVLHIEGENEDVVRCKDCKYWMYEYDETGLCVVDVPDIDGVQRQSHDYCSYGERKDNG